MRGSVSPFSSESLTFDHFLADGTTCSRKISTTVPLRADDAERFSLPALNEHSSQVTVLLPSRERNRHFPRAQILSHKKSTHTPPQKTRAPHKCAQSRLLRPSPRKTSPTTRLRPSLRADHPHPSAHSWFFKTAVRNFQDAFVSAVSPRNRPMPPRAIHAVFRTILLPTLAFRSTSPPLPSDVPSGVGRGFGWLCAFVFHGFSGCLAALHPRCRVAVRRSVI